MQTLDKEAIESIYLDVGSSSEKGIQAIRLHTGGHSRKGSQLLDLWLDQYKQGQSPTVELPLDLSLLPSFTQRVLRELQKIPFGHTMTYGEIAHAVGHPQAARAVGNACRVNPFPLVIPCHRVIQKKGSLGGFAFGLSLKKTLLNFEKQIPQASSYIKVS